METPISEPSKKTLKEKIIDRIEQGHKLSRNKTEIANFLQWRINLNEKESMKGDSDYEEQIIRGHLRGLAAEKINREMDLNECATVFESLHIDKPNLNALSLVSPEALIPNSKRKTDILKNVVKKGQEKTSKELIKLSYETKTPIDQLKEEIAVGYSQSVKDKDFIKGSKEGIFMSETVSPDSFIRESGFAAPIGLVETKSYRPNEVATYADLLTSKVTNPSQKLYVMATNEDLQEHTAVDENFIPFSQGLIRLGTDISKEMNFLDIIRANYFGEKRLDREALVVLRFPQDAPRPSLIKIGEFVRKFWGINIIIQVLPFRAREMEDVGVNLLSKEWADVKKGKMKMAFSQKRMKLIEERLLGLREVKAVS